MFFILARGHRRGFCLFKRVWNWLSLQGGTAMYARGLSQWDVHYRAAQAILLRVFSQVEGLLGETSSGPRPSRCCRGSQPLSPGALLVVGLGSGEALDLQCYQLDIDISP